MRSRIWAWIVTSRAVVGSSAMSSSGSQASAIAIITRWAMPPDISCGIRLEPPLRVGDADHRAAARAPGRGRPCASCPRWMLAAPRRSGRPTSSTGFSDEVGCWKIIAMRSPRILRMSSSETLSRSWPSKMTSPASIRRARATRRRIDRLSHALAAAGLADEAHDLAPIDVEVDAVDRPHHAVTGVERGPQAAAPPGVASPCSCLGGCWRPARAPR